MEINTPKTVCGCPCDGVIQKRSHRQSTRPELCQCTIANTGWVFSWGVFFWTLQQLTDEPSLDLYVWLGAPAPPLAQRQYCPCWTVTSCCVSRSLSICIRLYYSVIIRAAIGSLLVKLFACLGRTAGRSFAQSDLRHFGFTVQRAKATSHELRSISVLF